MKIGDLVRQKVEWISSDLGEIGIIIDFEINYDRFGDPIEKLAVVNWCNRFPSEQERVEELEVINENR